MATVSIANTTANVSGKTVVLAERDFTVTGSWTFDRDPSAPFTVTSGSAVVTNLDADKLDGQDGTYYTNATNLASGTVPTARLGTGTANSGSFLRGDQTWSSAFASNAICDGRLTLTTATPVTTSDVTGATNIYWTPYKGNRIALYDGSASWNIRTFTEITQALGTLTSGLPYDVFIYDNSGTPASEILAWTSTTARATALVLQDGVLVKSGATTRRYVGTFYTTSTTTTEDSVTKRYVWNYYNRVPRELKRTETNNTWTYNSATIRQANASGSNQVEAVIGYNEDVVDLSVSASWANPTSSNAVFVGIGLDSTTAFAGDQILSGVSLTGNLGGMSSARYTGFPGIGRHFFSWNETVVNSGTAVTFYSNATTTVNGLTVGAAVQSGIVGRINA